MIRGILIVEDQLIIALDLEQRLNALGYRVVGRARTSGQCLQMVQDLRTDLVLMDIRLDGDRDGIDTARELRRLHDLPVVFTSGFADPATLEEAKSAQTFGFLVKPFGDDQLRAAIEIAVQHHEIERQARDRLLTLANASTALTSSLDLEKTLAEVSSLVIPRLAVGCMIDGLEPDGSLTAVSVAHVQPESQRALRQATRLRASELDPERGIGRALVHGTDDVLPVCASPALVARALGIAHPEVLAPIWPMALLCIPLRVGARLIGVLSLFCSHHVPSDVLDRTLIEELARLIAIGIDNARLYQTAQRAIRFREDVLATAAHDLRGPLGNIILSLELLLKDVCGPALARVQTLRNSARHMRRMLDSLLSAAMLEAGHLVLAITCSPVTELVREVLAMFADAAANKRLVLSFTPPTETIELACDRDRIVEVLVNLVQNAVKFTPEGGSISITAQATPEEVQLSVADTGSGIPPEVLPLIFDRYRQGAAAPREGMGLGLFIVKGIVEAHHGRLGIESTPGVGTTVTLTLRRCLPSGPQ